MKKVIILLVFGVLVLGNFTLTQGDEEFDDEWRIDLKTTGIAHYTLKSKIPADMESYGFVLSRNVKNFKSYYAETNEEIEVEVEESGLTVKYSLKFGKVLKKGSSIVVEFDWEKIVVEYVEDVYSYSFSWGTGDWVTLHSVDVILPPRVEVLAINDAELLKTTREGNREILHFEEKSGGKFDRMSFAILYSGKGKSEMETADTYFNSKNYEEALSHYKNAKNFYEKIDGLFGDPADDMLTRLGRDWGMELNISHRLFSSQEKFEKFLNQIETKIDLCEDKLKERREIPRRPAFVAVSRMLAANIATKGANMACRVFEGR